MQARAISGVLSLPTPQRLPVVAEGLALLAEHVGQVHQAAKTLVDADERRGAAILEGVAVEQSASVLVLFDYARAGTRRQKQAAHQIRCVYDHVVRGVYAELATLKPKSFADVREIVEGLRVSHFLDGRNEIDWVFRNSIEDRRERAIYVDLVEDDDGLWWTSPGEWDSSLTWGLSRVPELVGSMSRTGLLSLEGLRLASQVWRRVEIEDATTFTEVAAVTRELLERTHAAGLASADVTDGDYRRIVDCWSFPLYDLDARKRHVPKRELDELRERFERNQAYAYGY